MNAADTAPATTFGSAVLAIDIPDTAAAAMLNSNGPSTNMIRGGVGLSADDCLKLRDFLVGWMTVRQINGQLCHEVKSQTIFIGVKELSREF